jgi:predicted Zn finger-like uncharacterized protein
MILECPNCEISYEIPVDLPPEGRKVRCASCQHVWTATSEHERKPDISLTDFEDEEIVFKEGEDAPDATSISEEAAIPDSTEEPVADFEPVADPAGEAAAEDGDAGEDLSDNVMKEAFAAAIDEAPGADTAIAGDEEEEPDSPPIVIGKAKKRRGPMLGNVAAGWAALALMLAGVMSLVYFQRVNVVRALPGSASAYERIGLPVNVRGLEFDDVKYSWETSAGRPVLEVFGNIVNVTSKPLKVPTVVFGLRTKEKVEVYQWAADVRSELLPPGKQTAFSAQIPTPPKSIRDVQVRFAKVR